MTKVLKQPDSLRIGPLIQFIIVVSTDYKTLSLRHFHSSRFYKCSNYIRSVYFYQQEMSEEGIRLRNRDSFKESLTRASGAPLFKTPLKNIQHAYYQVNTGTGPGINTSTRVTWRQQNGLAALEEAHRLALGYRTNARCVISKVGVCEQKLLAKESPVHPRL